ncbi:MULTISPECIES: aldo/keto reductase [unclassified Arsukibacterium]|uniref:aldo/keto reductase n=1 Tax=unclassified Arsukibacterium TaxID=2635278 RepID=UPI000C4F18D2|nr:MULTISPECIES: aldo/keto reductase [unclassified Arsukibacterium]MAA95185.1 aldo/keto reductase [Rheinheimera sp.]MBM35140.1 aldo/keto reductase [Rheinheimera sp.]HAW93511.1 aldo/keto reductase [Candidatus Azambacteria bacterium]
MQYSVLGSSNIDVSRVCLGTMTWGTQNTQQDADEQLAYALAHGVNFIDTAEMYSVPPTAESYGATERIIGDWLRRNNDKRSELIIASKMAGSGLSYIRGGGIMTPATLRQAVDDSLTRLQTDYLDLYQLHWPNRISPHFGRHGVGHISLSEANATEQTEQILGLLQALQYCVDAGKIRFCGLSNETPWGISQYLKLSAEHNLPKMVSIQNEFSLLHTKDWPYLIEQCVHENIAYLPWSPLAGGALSGKYLNGARPDGSRWSMLQRHGLFRDTPQSERAVAAFTELAASHQLNPAVLALAWVNQTAGVTSTIIGATSMAQLQQNIAAFSLTLNQAVTEDISQYLRQYPMPF